MFLIATTASPSQRFSITLERKPVEFLLRWAFLQDRWEMDLTIDGARVLAGQRLVMGIDLVGAHNFGIGTIFCLAGERPGDAPGRDELGDRVQLVHLTEAERDAAISP